MSPRDEYTAACARLARLVRARMAGDDQHWSDILAREVALPGEWEALTHLTCHLVSDHADRDVRYAAVLLDELDSEGAQQ